VPVAPEMKFRIGTASTAITSAAVGLLLEEGRLDLDEDIQTYVPEFPQKQRPVTLRQLMADVAGVPDDGGDEGPLFTERCERPADAYQFLSGYERELLFNPGTHSRCPSQDRNLSPLPNSIAATPGAIAPWQVVAACRC